MPIAIMHMMEGRDDAKKAKAIAAVTQALVESLDAKPESVRVIIQEIPKAHWGIAGKPSVARASFGGRARPRCRASASDGRTPTPAQFDSIH